VTWRFGGTRLASLALVAVLGANIRPASAEPAVRHLTALVPDDVGSCIEIRDLAENHALIFNGDLYRRLQSFPPTAQWKAEHGARLKDMTVRLAPELGVGADELWQKTFGRRVLFGVWPAAEGDAKGGTSLMLTESTDAELLRRLMSRLARGSNAAAGAVREVQHAGGSYFNRVYRNGAAERNVCFAAVDRVGVMSSSEEVMRRVLELHAAPNEPVGSSPPRSLGAREQYREAQAHVSPTAVMSVFVNPRSWDAVMAAVAPPIAETTLLKNAFLEAWKIAPYWVSSVEIGPSRFTSDTYLRFDTAALPPSLAELLQSQAGGTEFLNHVPQEAVVAYAGCVDLRRMAQFVEAGVDDQDRARLDAARQIARGFFQDLDLFDDVLAQLGPQVGMCMMHSPGEGEARPIDWVIAAQTRPRAAEDGRPDVVEAIDKGLQAVFNLLANLPTDANDAQQQAVTVRTTDEEGIRLTSIEGIRDLPPGFVGTYTFSNGYFIGGSTREIVRQAATTQHENSLANSDKLRELLSPGMEHSSQVFYFDCAALRRLHEQQPQVIDRLLALTDELGEVETARLKEDFLGFLRLGDRMVASVKFDSTGASLSLVFATPERR